MPLTYESRSTNPYISAMTSETEHSGPFDIVADEAHDAVAQPEPQAPDVLDTTSDVLNSSQLDYLARVEQALAQKDESRLQEVTSGIEALDSKISSYKFMISAAQRDLRALRDEEASATQEAAQHRELFAVLSERVREVSAQLQSFDIQTLSTQYDAAEADLRDYLLSLDMDPSAFVEARAILDQRKAYLIAERQQVQADIQATKNERFTLIELLRANTNLPDSRIYAINEAVSQLDRDLLGYERELSNIDERIGSYELYHEKYARLQRIDARSLEIESRYANLNAELNDLYTQISQLTGMPSYSDHVASATPVVRSSAGAAYHEAQPVMMGVNYEPEVIRDIPMPRIAIFQAKHRPTI